MERIISRVAALLSALSMMTLALAATSGSAWAGLEGGECPIVVSEVPAALSLQELDVCDISVEKTLTSANPAAVGGTVTFEVVVENTGNVDLTNVGFSDSYDQSHLDFVSADPAPSDVDEDAGILDWQDLAPSPDGGTAGVWEPGESRTVTVRFRALAVDGAGNCAVAFADVPAYQSDIGSDFSCAEVRIVPASDGGGRRESTNTPVATTPTAVPPTPVVSVSPATVVPPTPRPAGIVAPDTGFADRHNGGVPWALASVAFALLVVGAAAVRIARRRS